MINKYWNRFIANFISFSDSISGIPSIQFFNFVTHFTNIHANPKPLLQRYLILTVRICMVLFIHENVQHYDSLCYWTWIKSVWVQNWCSSTYEMVQIVSIPQWNAQILEMYTSLDRYIYVLFAEIADANIYKSQHKLSSSLKICTVMQFSCNRSKDINFQFLSLFCS